jgi:hypothetical protein
MEMKLPAQKLLLRRATAAAMLDTSISMVKRLEAMGHLTPIKPGLRAVFYATAEVEALAKPTRKQSKRRRSK